MSSVVTPLSRGRILRQQIPAAPPTYDQTYISQLAAAVNDYMTQATSPGDVVAGRFIWSLPVKVGPLPTDDYQNTSLFPTGMLYLMQVPGATPGTYFLTVTMPTDLAATGHQPTNKL